MTTDYIGATDDMNAMVLAAWNTATAAAVGTAQKMFFQGVVKDSVVEVGGPTEYWARTSYKIVDQGSIGPGAKRHCAYGLLFVQMYFPLSVTGSWRKGAQIGKAVKNALAVRSSSGTVWFRKPRATELDPEGAHHRLNVVAEFEYDEIVS